MRGRLDILTNGSPSIAASHLRRRPRSFPRLRRLTKSGDIDRHCHRLRPRLRSARNFQFQPELPQDEILARLIFKKGISELSPMQIAHLAAASDLPAAPAARCRLCAATGLDDLDIVTDERGQDGRARRPLRHGQRLSGRRRRRLQDRARSRSTSTSPRTSRRAPAGSDPGFEHRHLLREGLLGRAPLAADNPTTTIPTASLVSHTSEARSFMVAARAVGRTRKAWNGQRFLALGVVGRGGRLRDRCAPREFRSHGRTRLDACRPYRRRSPPSG